MYLFAQADLEEQITSIAIDTVAIAALALFVFTIIAVIVKNKGSKKLQKALSLPLFLIIAGTMAFSTLILIGSTVYLNVKSDSGGPVHWHAGIEYWVCGTEVNLRDPVGLLSNKVGSATYHEHNDKYIHLEGVVVDREYDASLDKFMTVTGGYINENGIGIPLSEEENAWFVTGDQLDGDPNNPENQSKALGPNGSWVKDAPEGKVLDLRNGQSCSDDQQPAEVQVFVYTYNKDDDTYSQQKVEDPGSYIMRDESSLGPPSDCVIIEYDQPKAATDRLCEQYGIKDVERCVSFGVSEFNPELCNIREVNKPAGPPEPETDMSEMQEPASDESEITQPADETVEPVAEPTTETPSTEEEPATNPDQPVEMEAQ